jgi:hypothetical protein
MKLSFNPKSAGFKKIGEGAFALAYVDNSHSVELITKVACIQIPSHLLREVVGAGGSVIDRSYFEFIDMSREALIFAREIAPQQLKKFLPEITRSRIDKDKFGEVEFVYSMPFYNRFNVRHIKPTEMEERRLEDILSLASNEIYKGSNYSARLIKHFSFFDGYTSSLSSLKDENLSISNSGSIIFRDPIICLFLPHDAVRLFAKNFQNSESLSYMSRYLKCTL